MRVTPLVLAAAFAGITTAGLAAQQPPPPLPFPRSSPPPTSSPAAPAPSSAPVAAPATPPAPVTSPIAPEQPTDAALGVPGLMYANAQLLESFDLGRGQRCYLLGTDAPFVEVVAYYKQTLKDGGRELFKLPAMQQFDLGKYQEQSMSAQPAVVVKDYSGSEGYLHVMGTQSKRYRTVIQIVPATPQAR